MYVTILIFQQGSDGHMKVSGEEDKSMTEILTRYKEKLEIKR